MLAQENAVAGPQPVDSPQLLHLNQRIEQFDIFSREQFYRNAVFEGDALQRVGGGDDVLDVAVDAADVPARAAVLLERLRRVAN